MQIEWDLEEQKVRVQLLKAQTRESKLRAKEISKRMALIDIQISKNQLIICDGEV